MRIKNLFLSVCCFASIASSYVHAGRSEPYDPPTAVKYAKDWALARNSAYTSFSSDCTNFVSQVLRAGGFRNTVTTSVYGSSYWHYSTSSKYSHTWVNAHALYTRFNDGYENWVKWAGMGSLNYGDIVFADWDGDNTIDHSMIVTGFKPSTKNLFYHITRQIVGTILAHLFRAMVDRKPNIIVLVHQANAGLSKIVSSCHDRQIEILSDPVEFHILKNILHKRMFLLYIMSLFKKSLISYG